MGNNISKTYPMPCIKMHTPKTVSWGHVETKIIPSRHDWESVPLLNEHAVAVKTAQIKKTPIVDAPVTPPVKKYLQLPPKPKWKWWQKILRGRGELAIAAFLATCITAGFAGPFALIIPAVFLAYCVGCYLYRKHGPKAEVVIREQQVSEKLRQKYLHKARAMRGIGNLEQAQVYERLAKKLK